MNLSEISIKKPVFAWVVLVGMMFFGYLNFRSLGISQMPDVDFPVLNLSVTWEGAAPEVLETDVVDVLEDAMMGLEGLKEISSSTQQGQASLTLEFSLDRDIDAAVQETQSKLAEAQRRLPTDIDPPIIRKINPEDQPIMWVGVSSTKASFRELMEYVDKNIKDKFKTVAGVGEVMLSGFTDPNLRVWVNTEKLASFELTVEDIVNAIQMEHVEVPAGVLETSRNESRVRIMGEARTVEDFQKIMIHQRGGQPMYRPIMLSEVASIEDGLADVKRISRVFGERAVGMGIKKIRGANAVATGHAIKQRVSEIKSSLPEGYSIGINFDSTHFIEEAVGELVFHMTMAAILTSLICWLFLGSLSSTFNIIIGIPFSLLGTFIFMNALNYTMNTFTLLGLTLAIGIIVDDAIMVLENIVRHREMGKSRLQAALDGAREISLAAVVATTAVVAIFLPVVFMEGIMGKFLLQFGVIISVAVVLSLFEAVSFAPMRCAEFLEIGERKTRIGKTFEKAMQRLTEAYTRALHFCLARRWQVLGASLVFFVLSMMLVGAIRKEFVPAQDQSMFMARIKTPIGSSMEFTDGKFKEVEALIMKNPDVTRYMAAVGGFSGGESNAGMIFFTLKPKDDRSKNPKTGSKTTQADIMGYFRNEVGKIPDVQIYVQDLSTRGLTSRRGFPVEFTIRGPDWDKLVGYSKQIMADMKKDPLFRDVDTDYLEGMPEVQIVPNRAKAFARGVSVSTIARTINALVAGERVGKYTSAGRRYDVRVSLIKDERQRRADIEMMRVRNNRGELVRLMDVVDFVERPSLMTITRRDRERAISVFSNVGEGQSQAAAMAKAAVIGSKILPQGYRQVLSGTSQTFKESSSSILAAFWLGVLIAYMVLASQFNHVIHPFTVLLALPFSLSGAFIALWMGGFSLNMFSVIGLLLLMGIVKKNSIMLVEFTNQLRERGQSPQDALRQACPIRFRPILMTSVSTITAAIPPALALGPGSETSVPMSVAIIGGVFVSTILTLFVVPCAYEVLLPLERRETFRKLLLRLKALKK